jgi:hypothetical protein
LRSQRRRRAGARHNHVHASQNQVSRQGRQAIVLAVRPAILDGNVSVLGIAGAAQAFAKRAQNVVIQGSRGAAEEPDHRHAQLLRARRHGPCG